VLFLGTLGGAAGLLVWAGCSSSSSGGGGSTTVDPGGTYGAEISVKVVGRGNVSSKLPGIDCPNSCFKRYAFKSAADVGATTGVTLTASVTSDKVRFAGWKLDATPLGTRGRGPDNCNPIVRDSTIAAVDTNAAEITLPFGTVQGRPPVGQEGACGGYTDVPTSYSITATFEDIPIPDAGFDADDGGGPDLLYDRPVYNSNVVTDAVGKEIGVPSSSSSYLYWRWQNAAGNSGISFGYTSGGLTPQVVVAPTQAINVFGVDYHVVFQTADGILHVIQGGGNVPVDLTGAPACVAVASDVSYVYCRTASTGSNGVLYQWSVGGGSPTQLFNNLPTGSDLWVDTSGGNVYLTDTAGGVATSGQVEYVAKSQAVGLDGGAATFTTLVSTQTNPVALRGNSYRLFWLQSQSGGGQGTASASKTGPTTGYTSFSLTLGVNRVAVGTSDSTYFWVATPTEISKAYYTGALPLSSLRSGLNTVGGLAVDSSYVYWTTADGRVFRHFRN
jgi:hypothetical protein